jgi:hypothetical protein
MKWRPVNGSLRPKKKSATMNGPLSAVDVKKQNPTAFEFTLQNYITEPRRQIIYKWGVYWTICVMLLARPVTKT